jgi:hypothetical protein
MNVNPSAADAFLRNAHLSSGVDALLEAPMRSLYHHMRLYGSSESSKSSSDDSTSSSDDASTVSTVPSLRQRDDHSSASSSHSSISDDPMGEYWNTFNAQYGNPRPPETIAIPGDNGDYVYDDFEDDLEDGAAVRGRRERSSNRYEYEFGDYLDCNYYWKFLCPGVRQRTYELSKDRKSTFRSSFRVPLVTIDHLTDKFIDNEWVKHTKRCRTDHQLYVRTQLFIMCALEHLGNKRPQSQFVTETNMSTSEHTKFFDLFLDKMYSVRNEYVYFPRSIDELKAVVAQYHSQHLPGACGSIDVVHVKWGQCPAGDFNFCKGKESFPSVALSSFPFEWQR